MPSRYSHVQLFATLWTITCQAPLHGILQARILGWVAMPSSRDSSQPRNLISPALAAKFFTTRAMFIYNTKVFFYWSIVDLQGCANLCCIAKGLSFTHIHSFINNLFHYGLSQETGYSSLCYTAGPCCLCILNVIACIGIPNSFDSIFNSWVFLNYIQTVFDMPQLYRQSPWKAQGLTKI